MRKRIKCYLCGSVVLYDDLSQNYVCSECNASHDSSVFVAEKIKNKRYRLTKFRVFVAVLAALCIVYYFFRFLT